MSDAAISRIHMAIARTGRIGVDLVPTPLLHRESLA
jgi:hypothetical protein